MSLVSRWFRIPFWQRVLAGFVLGALAGWALGETAAAWFQPLGTLYVTLIKMIATPLVFFAVINAVASLHGQQSVAALGGRTFAWFAATAALAVGVAFAVGAVMQPGLGLGELAVAETYVEKVVPGPVAVLLDVVPANPFAALADGKILQVIFFAGLVGFALVKLGERTAKLRALAGEASDVMIQVTRFVLEVTPIGTFGLIAALVGSYGFERLLPLGGFVVALYLACALHIVFVYGGLLLAHGLNPLRFLRGALPAMQVAFVASSSFAALPASLRAATHALGVKQDDIVANYLESNHWNQRFNLDANLEALEPGLTASVAASFQADFADSQQVTLEDWRARPFWRRVQQRLWGWLDRLAVNLLDRRR